MAKKRKSNQAPGRLLRTVQVDRKHRETTVTSGHPQGMYLEVVLKDNKGDSEVLTAVYSPADVALVENAITRMVRHYLKNFPLVPQKGFYSLLVVPRWVALNTEVTSGRN